MRATCELAMVQYLPTGGFKWMKLVQLGEWEKFMAEQEDEK